MLPALNAILNSLSALFITAGIIFISKRRITAHKLCMTSAFIFSVMFLVSYIVYHIQVGSVPFSGTGVIRIIYFIILISHIILAMVIVPMVLRTMWLAYKSKIEAHRLIGKWTASIWLYVSVTGVVIYLLLYQT